MANLDDVRVDDPCPRCGGKRRDAVVAVAPVHIGVTIPVPSVAIEPNPDPPWHVRWRDVRDSHRELADAYRTVPSDGNVGVDRRVHSFFGHCNDLIDWLIDDKVCSEQAVSLHWQSDLHLRIAKGVANTQKHRTITRGSDPITARIKRTVVHGERGTRVTIEYASPSIGDGHTRDALALADACVASWRRFFAQEEITEPSA